MTEAYPSALLRQPLRRPLGNEYRPMAATGAADGNGQIAFSFRLVTRQKWLQQLRQRREKLVEIPVRFDEPADRLVLAGKGTQRRLVVRSLPRPL